MMALLGRVLVDVNAGYAMTDVMAIKRAIRSTENHTIELVTRADRLACCATLRPHCWRRINRGACWGGVYRGRVGHAHLPIPHEAIVTLKLPS